MAQSKEQIIKTIDTYMQRFQYKNSEWYVGIASNPKQRLFNDHNVDEKNGTWIYEQASSANVAREVEQAYLNTGHDGGAGGGDDNTVFVYAYVKFRDTVR